MADDDLRTLTSATLFWSAMKDATAAQYNASREHLKIAMEQAGSEKQRTRDVDGHSLGTASVSAGRYVGEVHDRAAFLSWVAKNYPEEIIRAVRPSFEKVLVDNAAHNAADPEGPGPFAVTKDGAVVPGITAEWRDGSLTVTADREAKRRAAVIVGRLVAGAPIAPGRVWSGDTAIEDGSSHDD